MTSTLDVVEVSRRDRKKRATRQELSLAALNLVLEKGLANVTVEDISEAADVSTRTFFNYFTSKEAAIIGHNPDRLDRFRTTLMSRPADESPYLAVRAAILNQVAGIVEEASSLGDGRLDWLCRMHTVKSEPSLYAAYVANMSIFEKECVAALCERMGIDPDEDQSPALLVGTMLAASRISMMCWVASGGVGSALEITTTALDGLGAGFNHATPELKVPKGSLRRTKQNVTNYMKTKKVTR